MRILISIIFCCIVSWTVYGQNKIEKKLKKSKQTHEWITLEMTSGRPVDCFIAFPTDTLPTNTVIILHGHEGLSIFDKYYADQLAKKGILAIVPNLLPEKKMEEYREEDQSTKKLYPGVKDYSRFVVNDKQVNTELQTIFETVEQIPLSNGSIFLMGFGWGGYQAFQYASENPAVESFFLFYCNVPKVSNLYATMPRPIYAFYAENDKATMAQVNIAATLMKQFGNTFEKNTFPKANFDFMYSGLNAEATAADKKARKKAWKAILALTENKDK